MLSLFLFVEFLICFLSPTSPQGYEVLLVFCLAVCTLEIYLVSKICDSFYLALEREYASRSTFSTRQMLMSCIKEGGSSYFSLEAWKGT